MALAYKLAGFDSKTEALVLTRKIPSDKIMRAKKIAGIADNPAIIADWPLSHEQAWAIAKLIGAEVNVESFDWALEPDTIPGQRGVMSDYEEIEDVAQIAQLNEQLSMKLRESLAYLETRTIGYPHGSILSEVHFESQRGENVFWWVSRIPPNGKSADNYFGHGTPGDSSSLNIEMQFDVPIIEFSRRWGGAFLRYAPTNATVLAHRGHVTRGYGGIPKAVLFSEMPSYKRNARDGTGTGQREYLIISNLSSPTLVSDIERFTSDLRRTIRALDPHGRRH